VVALIATHCVEYTVFRYLDKAQRLRTNYHFTMGVRVRSTRPGLSTPNEDRSSAFSCARTHHFKNVRLRSTKRNKVSLLIAVDEHSADGHTAVAVSYSTDSFTPAESGSFRPAVPAAYTLLHPHATLRCYFRLQLSQQLSSFLFVISSALRPHHLSTELML